MRIIRNEILENTDRNISVGVSQSTLKLFYKTLYYNYYVYMIMIFLSIKTSLLMNLQHVERWQTYNIHSRVRINEKRALFFL